MFSRHGEQNGRATIDRRTRLWIATVRDSMTRNGKLSVDDCTRRQTDELDSGSDWPREQAGTGKQLTTMPVGRRTALSRHRVGCRRRTTTSDNGLTANKRLRPRRLTARLDVPKTDDGQPDTTDNDDDLSPTRLTTKNGWVFTYNDSALTQLTAMNVSALTRLLTDEHGWRRAAT